MAITESTSINQIEMNCDSNGFLRVLFVENKSCISKDGVDIASSYHREPIDPSCDYAHELLAKAILSSSMSMQRLIASATLLQQSGFVKPEKAEVVI